MQSVVTGQAPRTLEWCKITSETKCLQIAKKSAWIHFRCRGGRCLDFLRCFRRARMTLAPATSSPGPSQAWASRCQTSWGRQWKRATTRLWGSSPRSCSTRTSSERRAPPTVSLSRDWQHTDARQTCFFFSTHRLHTVLYCRTHINTKATLTTLNYRDGFGGGSRAQFTSKSYYFVLLAGRVQCGYTGGGG